MMNGVIAVNVSAYGVFNLEAVIIGIINTIAHFIVIPAKAGIHLEFH